MSEFSETSSIASRDDKAMQVIPAVDVMKGEVVRLLRGDSRFAKSYRSFGDPVTVARRWEAEGAQIIHVIDLDAALGSGNNANVIEDIVKAVKVSVQVGGGIRSVDAARALLNMDADRIILGSLAFEEPSAVKAMVNEFGKDRVIVALDHLNGVVMVHGWKTHSRTAVDDAVFKFLELGVELFLVTSVARDGTMTGPDLETMARLCRHGIGVIAAGGIGSLEDLIALKRLGVCGAIVGKALYDGSFTLSEALKIVEE